MANSDFEQYEPSESAPGPSSSRRTRRTSRTNLPWIWLAIAFLVVLILAAVVYLASGEVPTEPLIVEPTVTPTTPALRPTLAPKQARPTPTPTVEPPTATPKPPAQDIEIVPGIEVKVVNTGIDGLSIRSGPGTNYARLKTAYDGETLKVLEGPEETGGYRWWRLQDETDTIGWGAETWLQPIGE